MIARQYYWYLVIGFAASVIGVSFYDESHTKPHVIVIMADDMGRNDVGFHGSSQIPTPNIDALAYNGIVMDKFYTQCSCTPSRAALLTGKYPIRSGMQGFPMKAGENRSLPLDMPTMAEQLKKLGYKTHLIGKWHLGSAYRSSTPTRRGFDTHFGYWNGFIGYFDYEAYQDMPDKSVMSGLDLHDALQPVWSEQGKYATKLFTEKAESTIKNHDPNDPLFLMVSHLAPHTGNNGTELGVPNINETIMKYSYIKDPQRQLYADVVNHLDESVGSIVKALEENNMLQKSIVLFLSDNGAPTVGLYGNSGSNWPLRGIKLSDFEGGVRTAATVFSPLFQKRGYVNKELMHITDWLPTFYAAAGGDLQDLGNIDGINQWETLVNNTPTKRTEILVGLNEVFEDSAIIMESGRYKLVNGTYVSGKFDQYYGETGRELEVPPYSALSVLQSPTNLAIEKVIEPVITEELIQIMRAATDLSWCRNKNETLYLNCAGGCLFDLINDPCETTDLKEALPDIAKKLFERIDKFREQLIPQKIAVADPAANPVFYNNTWCTWLDDELCVKTDNKTVVALREAV